MMTLAVPIAFLAALGISQLSGANLVRDTVPEGQSEPAETVVVIAVPLTPCTAIDSDTEALVMSETNPLHGSTVGYIPDFYIDRHEVSVGSYFQFAVSMIACHVSFFDGHRILGPHPHVGDTVPWLILRSTRGCIVACDSCQAELSVRPGCENLPITGVTYYGAEAFAMHHGRRLPTEEQWERAARGGSVVCQDGLMRPNPMPDRIYPWGNDLLPKSAPGRICPVDDRTWDISATGCYFMGGNVREWVQDACTEAADDSEGCPAGYPPGGLKRRIKGGSSYLASPVFLFDCLYPELAESDLVFRCVRVTK